MKVKQIFFNLLKIINLQFIKIHKINNLYLFVNRAISLNNFLNILITNLISFGESKLIFIIVFNV